MLYTYPYHKNCKRYHIQWKHRRRVKQEKYQNEVLIWSVWCCNTCPSLRGMHEFLCHPVQLFQCIISAKLIHLYQLYEQEHFCSHCWSSSMYVSLGVGLLLQFHMDELRPVYPTLGRKMGNLVVYFSMLQL